nr:integrase, catalytic region, zinc finger, CCHC-type, peptidase aspartic, catalytic [Tanacetum cinerariifolium]
MTENLKLLCNFMEKYLGMVRFKNDQFSPILGYGDLVQGNVTIKMVYYIEGLNPNLFSVGQFGDADLEVAFRKSTCFIKDLQGNDLLTGNVLKGSRRTKAQRGYTNSSMVWHRKLSHINFDTINLPSKNDIVNGLPKSKYVKDQLCSSCELGKAKKVRDGKYLDKMKEKGDLYIFMGYSTMSNGYRVHNKRTRLIVESIHIIFDDLKESFDWKQFGFLLYALHTNHLLSTRWTLKWLFLMVYWRKRYISVSQTGLLILIIQKKSTTLGKHCEESSKSLIYQSPRGIFINQSKYALEILKKHGMDKCDSIGTPMDTKPKLDEDLSGTHVDQTRYKSMIGSLVYLTSSRPNIVQA